ncbi:MATE family efflux transporter [Chloroflexota bacterium]
MVLKTDLKKDWTEGSVARNLWFFSWPIMISQSLGMIGPTIDMVWIGRLGTAAIAGVGVSGMIVQVVNSLTMGLFTGLRAIVGRFVGAGDNESANHILQQAFVISAGFSIVIAVIGLFLTEPILIAFGVEPDVVTEGSGYMRIQLVGMVTMTLLAIAQSALQASGDPKTMMRITIFYRILHVILVPFFIFGWWIFPNLGVSGAALTNVVTQGIGGALGLWFLFGGRSRLKPTLVNFKLDWEAIWRLLRIGIPASVTGTQRFLPGLILVWFVSPFGTFAVAAYSLMQRIDNFIRNPAASLGRSTGILAAQNLGAGKPERAEKGGWLGAGIFTCVAVVISIVIWFWAEGIIGIFNTEPGLVDVASSFLRIQIVSYMLMGLVVVLSMCIEGTGDTVPSMIITLASMWIVQIPLAYFIANHTGIGVYGVPWSIALALLCRAIFYSAYFRSGRWKRKKV